MLLLFFFSKGNDYLCCLWKRKSGFDLLHHLQVACTWVVLERFYTTIYLLSNMVAILFCELKIPTKTVMWQEQNNTYKIVCYGAGWYLMKALYTAGPLHHTGKAKEKKLTGNMQSNW